MSGELSSESQHPCKSQMSQAPVGTPALGEEIGGSWKIMEQEVGLAKTMSCRLNKRS